MNDSLDRSSDIENLNSYNNNYGGPIMIYLNIITLSLLFLTGIISLILHLFIGNPILCFNFDVPEFPFQTHVISIYVIVICILIGAVTNTIALLKINDDNYKNILCNDVSYNFIISCTCLSVTFLIGLFSKNEILSLYFSLCFYAISFCLSFMSFIKIKNRRNITNTSLYNLNIFTSILLSFITYLLLFNFIRVSTGKVDENYTMALAIMCIYGAFSVVLMAIYKDIIYSIVLLIILIGYTVLPVLTTTELVTSLSIMAFIVLSLILTALKYKKMVFGFEDSSELLKNLRDISSNK